MDAQSKVRGIFLIVYLSAIIIEIIWTYFRNKGGYNWKDSGANFLIVLGSNLLKPLTVLWATTILFLAKPIQLFEIPINLGTLIVSFFLVELVYYWYHRLSHEWAILWSVHHTHHSSPWFNFATAGRLNWVGKLTSPLFYIPLVFIGIDPMVIGLFLALSLLYQVFIHTEMVGKLGFFEGLFFNTPSAHRVHHGSNPEYIDKNYGGTLIIFDRIFGTYQPETVKVKYGVTSGFIGHNPFVIQFKPIWDYIKGNFKREEELLSKGKLKTSPSP